MLTPPVPENKVEMCENSKDTSTTITTIAIENNNKKSSTKENRKESTEESLTPPLLPNMKIQTDEKEKKDELKPIPAKEWDMFAEQDIFKADTNVSLYVFRVL